MRSNRLYEILLHLECIHYIEVKWNNPFKSYHKVNIPVVYRPHWHHCYPRSQNKYYPIYYSSRPQQLHNTKMMTRKWTLYKCVLCHFDNSPDELNHWYMFEQLQYPTSSRIRRTKALQRAQKASLCKMSNVIDYSIQTINYILCKQSQGCQWPMTVIFLNYTTKI